KEVALRKEPRCILEAFDLTLLDAETVTLEYATSEKQQARIESDLGHAASSTSSTQVSRIETCCSPPINSSGAASGSMTSMPRSSRGLGPRTELAATSM